MIYIKGHWKERGNTTQVHRKYNEEHIYEVRILPGKIPSSIAALVAFKESVTLSFLSPTSASLAPPTCEHEKLHFRAQRHTSLMEFIEVNNRPWRQQHHRIASTAAPVLSPCQTWQYSYPWLSWAVKTLYGFTSEKSFTIFLLSLFSPFSKWVQV